jgi:hypothetical protein
MYSLWRNFTIGSLSIASQTSAGRFVMRSTVIHYYSFLADKHASDNYNSRFVVAVGTGN